VFHVAHAALTLACYMLHCLVCYMLLPTLLC
jgi:hypothetical protein